MTEPRPYAIDAHGLVKLFGERTAVNRVELQVKRGQIHGLIGPDGAGKTTTIRMLCGVLELGGGSATIAGCDVGRDRDMLKQRIGYMPQRFSLYPDLTVIENLTFFADIFSVVRRERDERIPELLRFSALTDFQQRPAGLLSGGMKQKLALACTLIHRPEMLFLDEPTTGVDPVARREFWRILYDLLKDGVTVLVATPYMDEAARCATVSLMDNGQVITTDEPRNLQAKMPFNVLEVRAQPLDAARNALRNLPEVSAAQMFGTTLHLLTQKYQETEQAVAHTLQEKGIQLISMRHIPPSIEDVFVALTVEREAPHDQPSSPAASTLITSPLDHD